MPAKPPWLCSLPEILDQLGEIPAPVVDRALVEKIFHLSTRGAHHFMTRMGAGSAGRSLWLDRAQLIKNLRRILAGDDYYRADYRAAKLASLLTQTRKERIASSVRIEVKAETFGAKLDGLPEGVQVGPGEVRVSGETTMAIAEKLFALAQAILNDFERFDKAVQKPAITAKPR